MRLRHLTRVPSASAEVEAAAAGQRGHDAGPAAASIVPGLFARCECSPKGWAPLRCRVNCEWCHRCGAHIEFIARETPGSLLAEHGIGGGAP